MHRCSTTAAWPWGDGSRRKSRGAERTVTILVAVKEPDLTAAVQRNVVASRSRLTCAAGRRSAARNSSTNSVLDHRRIVAHLVIPCRPGLAQLQPASASTLVRRRAPVGTLRRGLAGQNASTNGEVHANYGHVVPCAVADRPRKWTAEWAAMAIAALGRSARMIELLSYPANSLRSRCLNDCRIVLVASNPFAYELGRPCEPFDAVRYQGSIADRRLFVDSV
jgi:hypothetical protein